MVYSHKQKRKSGANYDESSSDECHFPLECDFLRWKLTEEINHIGIVT